MSNQMYTNTQVLKSGTDPVFSYSDHWVSHSCLFVCLFRFVFKKKYIYIHAPVSQSPMHCPAFISLTGCSAIPHFSKPHVSLAFCVPHKTRASCFVWASQNARPRDRFCSRLVPYIPIHNQSWAVQAWKEKLPTYKDIGLPSDLPKSDGEPV